MLGQPFPNVFVGLGYHRESCLLTYMSTITSEPEKVWQHFSNAAWKFPNLDGKLGAKGHQEGLKAPLVLP